MPVLCFQWNWELNFEPCFNSIKRVLHIIIDKVKVSEMKEMLILWALFMVVSATNAIAFGLYYYR